MRAVNLLPDEFRPRQAAGEARGAYVVMGVLGALLVMVLVYALAANKVNSGTTDLATAKAEADRAEAKAKSEATFTDFRQVKETRLASVKDLAQVRFDWERLMRELARVIPEDTWVNDMTASTSSQTEGAAPAAGATTPPPAAPTSAPGPSPAAPGAAGANAAAAAGAVSPTLLLKGCALRQPAVATLMVRLRKLHRVTDVQLGESVQEVDDTASAGGGDSATAGTEGCGRKNFKFDVSVTFAPVDPDNAKPLKIPTSLGGGS